MLLVTAAMALAAAAILAWMGKRYASLGRPTASVDDVVPAQGGSTLPLPDLPAPAAAPAIPADAPVEDAAAASPEPAEVDRVEADPPIATPSESSDGSSPAEASEPAADLDPAVVRAFEGFAATRGVIRAFVEESPGRAQSLLDEHTGNTGHRDQVKMFATHLIRLRIERAGTADEHGLSEEEYVAIRDAYRAWKRGETVDPAWAAAFEGRPDLAEAADLGDHDFLDY